jgi:hypothetical protein
VEAASYGWWRCIFRWNGGIARPEFPSFRCACCRMRTGSLVLSPDPLRRPKSPLTTGKRLSPDSAAGIRGSGRLRGNSRHRVVFGQPWHIEPVCTLAQSRSPSNCGARCRLPKNPAIDSVPGSRSEHPKRYPKVPNPCGSPMGPKGYSNSRNYPLLLTLRAGKVS